MTPLLGCLGLLLVAGVLTGEAYSFIVAHQLLGTYARELIGGTRWTDTLLPILLTQGVAIVAGVLLVKAAIASLPTAMMGTLMGQGTGAGRLMVRMLAGILLIIPGFFLDLVALLLLSPLGGLLASLGQRIAMSLVRQQMKKMFPGGMHGAGGPMAFPGMLPRGLTPDAQVTRSGKVIDTTAERVDGKDR